MKILWHASSYDTAIAIQKAQLDAIIRELRERLMLNRLATYGGCSE